ncbi:MAG: 4Fe-4S cluster-binding domain-containing protein [Gammaproteobacteria bacterium]
MKTDFTLQRRVSYPDIPQRPQALASELFSIALDDDKYIVYAPLRKSAFIGNSAVVNFLADLKEHPELLAQNSELIHFLRNIGIINDKPETKPITSFSGAPKPVTITLFLTNACNLRCTYCYASAGVAPIHHMSLDVAKHGIDFIINNAVTQNVPYIRITYHGGGEPSVNWKVMTNSLAYAKAQAEKHGLNVHASSATNGMLNDKQSDWFIRQLDGASISFDGLPRVHDKFRVTTSGHGSSQHIENTLKRFDIAGFNYGLRMTVTHEQIATLPDSVEYICRRFNPAKIQVEPAYQMGKWATAPSAETDEFIAAFREAQARARKYTKQIDFSAARVGLSTNHFCSVSQDNFALSADGNVSACYEVFSEDDPYASHFFYGEPDHVNGGYTFNIDVLNRLRNQAVQNRKYCEECFAKWNCAGDCYSKLLHASDGKEIKGSNRCHIIRELSKDQILQKISDSGGLFWCEPTV